MQRQVGPNGLALTRYCEGSVDRVYLDPVGIATGGVGHVIRAADGPLKPGDSLSEAQIEKWLQQDLGVAEAAVNDSGLHFTQNQFDALVDFAFNEGSGNLADLLGNADGLPATIAQHFVHYTRAGNTHPRGLLTRRLLERDLFLAPDGPMPAGWLTKWDHIGDSIPGSPETQINEAAS